jgi:hypothetical protein
VLDKELLPLITSAARVMSYLSVGGGLNAFTPTAVSFNSAWICYRCCIVRSVINFFTPLSQFGNLQMLFLTAICKHGVMVNIMSKRNVYFSYCTLGVHLPPLPSTHQGVLHVSTSAIVV